MKRSILTRAGLPSRISRGLAIKQRPQPNIFQVERPGEHAKLIRELGLFNCHWPLFDRFDANSSKFCGRPTDKPPYCEKHTKRAGGGKRPLIAFPLFRSR
jgi:hypothetical protein